MDQGRRTLNPNGSPGNPSSSQGSSLPSVTPSGPWHSTPVKKSEIQNMARQLSPPVLSPRTTSLHIPQDSQTLGEMESATIQRQRRELLLLVAELKDRDQELNTTAAAHHKQLQAWEQDRQRVLTLEQRSARLEDELHKRNEVIRAVTKHVHIVEAREKEVHRDLNSTQQQLHDLGKKEQDSSRLYQDLEERNRSLSSTVTALSAQVGSLQVREAELSAMLRLKDKDVTEATNHIVDLSGRLRESEASLQESRSRERRLLREEEARKRRHREVRNENARLKGELQEQMTESSAQREEMIRLKQESQLLRSELALSGEGKSWKDDLLGLARSKQERTESELHCLRQVCENQQNDLQLLQLNLESARESLKQNEGSLADLGSIYLDDPSPSAWTRRNPGPANDSASPTATNKQAAVNGDHGILSAALGDDDQRCSSGLLQRLLAESREMVASLERAKLQPLSPSHNCDAVLSRSISQDSGSSGSSHQRHHHAGQGSPCGPSHQRHHHVSQGSPCGPSHQRHHHVSQGSPCGSSHQHHASQGSPCGSSHHHQGSPCGSSHHHQGAPCGSSHHRHDSQGSPYHPAFQTHQNSETPPRGNQCLNNTKEPSGL